MLPTPGTWISDLGKHPSGGVCFSRCNPHHFCGGAEFNRINYVVRHDLALPDSPLGLVLFPSAKQSVDYSIVLEDHYFHHTLGLTNHLTSKGKTVYHFLAAFLLYGILIGCGVYFGWILH